MFGPSHCTEHNSFSLCSSLQQLAADPQSWTEVYAVLKGTSLFCYHRQEDVGANVEPAFTIAVNKVSEGSTEAARGERNRCESFALFLDVDPSSHKLRFVFPKRASGGSEPHR